MLTFSPNSDLIAAEQDDHTIWVWDPENPSAVKILSAHHEDIQYLIFSPNSKMLLSVSGFGVYMLWGVEP